LIAIATGVPLTRCPFSRSKRLLREIADVELIASVVHEASPVP